MGRGQPPREDLPQLRTVRAPPGPIPTLARLRNGSCWLWAYCNKCHHNTPIALAPFLIRWVRNPMIVSSHSTAS
jgi:hypothetical protein